MEQTHLQGRSMRTLLHWYRSGCRVAVLQRSAVVLVVMQDPCANVQLSQSWTVRNYMGFPRCCPGVGQACSQKVHRKSHTGRCIAASELHPCLSQDLEAAVPMQKDWRIPYCCQDEHLYSLIGKDLFAALPVYPSAIICFRMRPQVRGRVSKRRSATS